jgi:hypothetical protein
MARLNNLAYSDVGIVGTLWTSNNARLNYWVTQVVGKPGEMRRSDNDSMEIK